jgi:hypothetical protein
MRGVLKKERPVFSKLFVVRRHVKPDRARASQTQSRHRYPNPLSCADTSNRTEPERKKFHARVFALGRGSSGWKHNTGCADAQSSLRGERPLINACRAMTSNMIARGGGEKNEKTFSDPGNVADPGRKNIS